MIATGRADTAGAGIADLGGPTHLPGNEHHRLFQQSAVVQIFEQRRQTGIERGEQHILQLAEVVGMGVPTEAGPHPSANPVHRDRGDSRLEQSACEQQALAVDVFAIPRPGGLWLAGDVERLLNDGGGEQFKRAPFVDVPGCQAGHLLAERGARNWGIGEGSRALREPCCRGSLDCGQQFSPLIESPGGEVAREQKVGGGQIAGSVDCPPHEEGCKSGSEATTELAGIDVVGDFTREGGELHHSGQVGGLGEGPGDRRVQAGNIGLVGLAIDPLDEEGAIGTMSGQQVVGVGVMIAETLFAHRDRPDEGQVMGQAGESGEVLCPADAGDRGVDGLEFAAVFERGFRLEVKGVGLSRATKEKEHEEPPGGSATGSGEGGEGSEAQAPTRPESGGPAQSESGTAQPAQESSSRRFPGRGFEWCCRHSGAVSAGGGRGGFSTR